MDRFQLAVDSVVSFFYGLGFFVLGTAAAFHYQPRSEFRLTKSIWALAGFGVLHAFHEWARVFAPIQQQVLSPSGFFLFTVGEGLASAFSWALLLYFGVILLPDRDRLPGLALRAPAILALAWGVAAVHRVNLFFAAGAPAAGLALEQLVRTNLLASCLLGLPATLVTTWALSEQAAHFQATRLERLVGPLRTAAVSFLAYAVLTLSSLVNPRLSPDAAFLSVAGDPTWDTAVRLAGLAIIVAIDLAVVRVLQVFDLEGERRLEEAETQRAILNERLRISRDLHDGVMQSVYAVGLALENVVFLLNEDRERARQELERSMTRLNDTIRDIRGYILNLRPTKRSAEDLYASVLDVVTQFRAGVTIRANIDLEALRGLKLAPERVEQICQIVREALTNVGRHAQATEVAVAAQAAWGKLVEISVWDNGRGFNLSSESLEGRQGLGNMRARAEELGGSLTVHSRQNRGTEVVLRLPVGGGSLNGAEDSHSAG